MTPGGIEVYERTGISTAGQGKLILLLYDGAIAALRQAAEEIRQKRYETKGKLLDQARQMVEQLWASLNREAGPITESLESLYNYMIRRILHINSKLDAKAAEEVACLLSELREAWQVAINQTGTAQKTAEKVRIGSEQTRGASSLRVSLRG